MRFRRAPTPARVTITDAPRRDDVPETGAASSVQCAEIELPERTLEALWKRENLERLARAYWRYLNRISLGLLRVVYSPAARTVVFLFRPFALLSFRAPEYETSDSKASVTWPIDRGLLVASEGHGQGFLRIAIERRPSAVPGQARLGVSAEVRNFYPWLRGSGRFARFGTWLYSRTQLRIHVIVTHGFLRSLARLDLPPSRIGALQGEIAAGAEPGADGHRERLPPERAGH